jgi:hypothetical protein
MLPAQASGKLSGPTPAAAITKAPTAIRADDAALAWPNARARPAATSSIAHG